MTFNIKTLNVLTLPLIFAVIGGATSEPEAIYQRYANCAVPLINGFTNGDRCSITVSFLSCVKSVTTDFDPYSAVILDRLQNLTISICYPDHTQIQEWKNATMCVLENLDKFLGCTGKVDSCTAASDRLSCFNSTIKENCAEIGEISAVEVKLILTKLFNDCEHLADNSTAVCLMKNSNKILSCNLGRVFNTVGDICTYAVNLLRCVATNSEKECGKEGKLIVEAYFNDTEFFMRTCKELNAIKDISLPECEKQVLQCDADLLNVEKCEDVKTYVECMSDALKKCDPKKNFFYVVLLEKYKVKFTEYCNPQSTFNKNVAKSAQCISTKSNDVMSPCYRKLLKDISELKETDKVGYQKSTVNFFSCLSKGFGRACDGNAESVMNELLTPFSQSLDDLCRSLTGERCNGAAVLMAGTWLFIASLIFLWTQKDE